ncbi:hypothetical protein NDU88_007136 [Pleurodeles waltl]|uniref:N-acetyltransferase domain-containing protein n=1 Tax=Pleurodeles waltl TaxID=8319 RepID=A0AAV7WG69_PLEWA|nr:hypothetical protein NDU88_007136 [Pleurodeles waltl]
MRISVEVQRKRKSVRHEAFHLGEPSGEFYSHQSQDQGSPPTADLTTFYIRMYRDSDYHTVRDLFASDLQEHVPALRIYALKHPQTTASLLALALSLFLLFRSVLLSALVPMVCLAAGWVGVSGIYSAYITQCLQLDMMDIQQAYMRKEGCYFWVVELNAEVVGMVAAAPPYNASDSFTVELKRLSVKKECRRLGIATALCKTVLNFAKDEGYKSVMLETSTMQLASIRLYEGIGFRKSHSTILPTFIGRIIQFYDISYKYELSEWNR